MRKWILIACAFSFVLCLYVDFFYFPPTVTGDEQRFMWEAKHLLGTGEFSVWSWRAWEMPGTAIFFALLGADIHTIRIAQALLHVGHSLIVGLISWQVFNRRDAAIIALGIAAFYPFFVLYQALALSDTLFMVLLSTAVCALYGRRPLLAAILFGLCGWIKPVLLLLPPFLAPRRYFLGSAIIYCAVLAPWTVRNYLVLDAFVPFTTGSAENLYLGNNDHNPTAGVEWQNDVDQAFVAYANSLPEFDRQSVYRATAVTWMRSHPTEFLALCGKRLVRFWNVMPNKDLGGGVAWISALSFGPVLFFAVWCLWIEYAAKNASQRHRISPILALIGYFTLLHCVTIASLRYRLPIEPFLIVLASWPLALLLRQGDKLSQSWPRRLNVRPSLLNDRHRASE